MKTKWCESARFSSIEPSSTMECHICYNLFDTEDRRPLNLECSHTFCKGCISQGRLRTCPTCRYPIKKAATRLLPNFAIMEAITAASGVRDLGAMLEMIGIGAAKTLMLDPSDITLGDRIGSGGMGTVYHGRLCGDLQVNICSTGWMETDRL